MKYIDSSPESADTMKVACNKINDNFKEIKEKLSIKEEFKKVKCESISDLPIFAEDINNNFRIVDKYIKTL